LNCRLPLALPLPLIAAHRGPGARPGLIHPQR
jgi:hypothetical protein